MPEVLSYHCVPIWIDGLCNKQTFYRGCAVSHHLVSSQNECAATGYNIIYKNNLFAPEYAGIKTEVSCRVGTLTSNIA